VSWLRGIAVGGAVLVLVVGGGLAVTSLGQLPRASATPTPSMGAVVRGNIGPNLYVISDVQSQQKKLAQFDPPLQPDDAKVLPALKVLAKDGYNMVIPDTQQPVVETVNEVNVVSFEVEGVKIYFELFKNSHGEVGSVRFWRAS
jgi:hypothetical protein